MKSIITILLLLISLPCWGFDYSVLQGNWAIYHKDKTTDEKYHFLNINKNLSGTFVRSLGYQPITRAFKSSDVRKRDGCVEIDLHNNEKAVLSAWKLKSGDGRLNGVIYMYKDTSELFNTLYFPLQLLNENHIFLSHKSIRELNVKYR